MGGRAIRLPRRPISRVFEMDNCVCITEWLSKMTSLLQSINGQEACTSEQCFTNEFGVQNNSSEMSPEDTMALVPFVIMLIVFMVMSVRHFSQRSTQSNTTDEAECGPSHPHSGDVPLLLILGHAPARF